jgi:hypothetical protein
MVQIIACVCIDDGEGEVVLFESFFFLILSVVRVFVHPFACELEPNLYNPTSITLQSHERLQKSSEYSDDSVGRAVSVFHLVVAFHRDPSN